jgi:hypothetical protein
MRWREFIGFVPYYTMREEDHRHELTTVIAYGKALSRMSQQHIQLTKMCHGMLPTATITHRYDPKSSPRCPYCKTADEDRDHVLKCPHSEKLFWPKHAIIAQQKRCTEMHTREMLTTILKNGIQAWFDNSPMQPENYPPTFHQLIKDHGQPSDGDKSSTAGLPLSGSASKTNTCAETGLQKSRLPDNPGQSP